MNIAMDGRFLVTPFTGNGRYTSGLIKGMKTLQESDDYIKLTVYAPDSLESHPLVDKTFRNGRFGRILTDLPNKIRSSKSEVYHSQYTLPIIPCGCKTILTIHDAAFARKGKPDYSLLKTVAFSYFASKADAIITVSEFSKQDLEKHLLFPCNNIIPIPNGCEIAAPSEESVAYAEKLLEGCDGPLVLYIGRIAKRKRIPLLIKAFNTFRRRHGGTLLIVGPDDDDSGIVNQLVRDCRNVLRIKNASEELKGTLLMRAHAFVYLSEYEGFGLPVIESLKSGIPTVITNTPALQEVAQDAAITVAPIPEAISAGIEEAVFRFSSRQIQNGKNVANKYTWKNTARQTLQVYSDVFNKL